MDIEVITCVWLLYRRYKRRRQRQREYWVHPILRDRLTHGMFVTLYPKLRQHGSKFFNYFRMSIQSFDELLGVIKADITGESTILRDSISAQEKLVITLRQVLLFFIQINLGSPNLG